MTAAICQCVPRRGPGRYLSQWHGFRFSSTALRHRLPGGHRDWEHLITPGWIATLYGSAGLETTFLKRGRNVKKKQKKTLVDKIWEIRSNLWSTAPIIFMRSGPSDVGW